MTASGQVHALVTLSERTLVPIGQEAGDPELVWMFWRLQIPDCPTCRESLYNIINPLTPNDDYCGRTALLTSKRCILYIYSTHIGTEYFKHCIYSPFFPFQNAVCFITLTYLVPILFTFYVQGLLKFKKIIPAPKG